MVRYIRPSWILAKVINPLAMRFGPVTTLTVRTRATGKNQRLPVNVLEVNGHRYLVSVRGDAEWVRNLRAAGSCELRRRGWVQRFSAVEVPPSEREPLISRYRAMWESQVNRFFTELPDPADHPVFELRP
jgi:deazaflavin-dependent oxidoreductase (nitroreductase family)